MKMKMTERNGAVVLVVAGARQQLTIVEENGCFTIEVADIAHTITPAAVPECTQTKAQNAQEECSPAAPSAPAAVEHTQPQDNTPQDDAMFNKLVALRKSLATADNVPPYLIFHNKTLREMCEKMPADMQAMGNISGVGQAKLEKYGHAFLDAINGGTA